MVQLTDVSKKLGKFQMQNITLDIPRGYITGVIGRNGAGKTTLFHLMLGLYKADTGTVRVDGMDYREMEVQIREETGVVLQERMFEAQESLMGNADLYGKYYRRYDRGRMMDLLEQFDLKPEQKYKTLSKGEELKFQYAFALAHQPKLLLLDEPTGNFDQEFREAFWKYLKDFIADGERTVILATHLTDDLDRMADYIVYMEDGTVLLQSDVEAIRRDYRIIQGDCYKVKLFPNEYVIAMEESAIGAKALVRHKKRFDYRNLIATPPTIEDLMYFMSKRKDYGKQMEKGGDAR